MGISEAGGGEIFACRVLLGGTIVGAPAVCCPSGVRIISQDSVQPRPGSAFPASHGFRKVPAESSSSAADVSARAEIKSAFR